MIGGVLDLDLGELDGIGPATERKLRESGVGSVLELAASLPDELVESVGGSRESASALIFVAQNALRESGLLEKEFMPASEVFDRRQAIERCSTGSRELDSLFKGGVETQAITELWGEYGSGKTQLCHTLCVNSQLPREQGGLGGKSLYIDTESTFRPERLYQIAEGRGMDPSEVLRNVVFCKVYNSSHLELAVKTLGKHIEKEQIKLLVVDSVISLHRAEYAGRGTLAERQQKLNGLIHRLLRISEIYNVAVVVTNQVQSKPDTFFGDPTRPAGGHVIAHACTYRVYLRKSGQDRKAIMVDSPYHPYSEAIFTVSDKGVTDHEPKKKLSD